MSVAKANALMEHCNRYGVAKANALMEHCNRHDVAKANALVEHCKCIQYARVKNGRSAHACFEGDQNGRFYRDPGGGVLGLQH